MQCGLSYFPYCSLTFSTGPISVPPSASIECASAIKPAIIFCSMASTILEIHLRRMLSSLIDLPEFVSKIQGKWFNW